LRDLDQSQAENIENTCRHLADYFQ